MRSSLLLTAAALLLASSTYAAGTQQKKIGGSGPYDRPTVHTGTWCYVEWSQTAVTCAAEPDTFVADGDSAVVRFTVRNWRPAGASIPAFQLDNVAVVSKSIYDSYLLPVGLLVDEYGCELDPAAPMLDFASIAPRDLPYFTSFDGGYGQEWSGDLSQVSWEDGLDINDLLTFGPMFDDPFNPVYDAQQNASSNTGAIRIGQGTGPEFVTIDLQLTDLVIGEEYVVTYWSRSTNGGNTCQMGPPYDTWEVEIFGETLECAPDPPQIEILEFRTLAWNPVTDVWRFQARVTNTGQGDATGVGMTLTDATVWIPILDNFGEVGAVPVGGDVWTGSFEVDLTNFPPLAGEPLMEFHFNYLDDCADRESQDLLYQTLAVPAYPTDAPSVKPPGSLAQNVPNPFNPRTRIEFTLQDAATVRLDVLDIRGRVVRRLFEGSMPGGMHATTWDGTDEDHRAVAAGPYFYALQTPSGTITRKMVLLK